MPLPQWRRNQIAVTLSGAFLNFGFTLVMSFLPIYVRQLGIQTIGGIALWSGVILSASPLMAALMGPVWGRLGDRKGMRIIITRATAVNSLCWFLMAFAQDVWQLLFLRVLLGIFGGFDNVAVAVITQGSPKERVPSIIGTLQSVQILSAAIGPFFGGLLASSIGIRNTFLVTGLINSGSFLSILLLYRDPTAGTVYDRPCAHRAPLQFWKQPEFITALLLLFFINLANKTFGPIIPLFLEQLGTPRLRLELVAGAVISSVAFVEAIATWASGKLALHVTLRQLILVRLGLSVFVLIPMVFVRSTGQFCALLLPLALLVGGTRMLALTAGHHVIPPEQRGAGFALLSGTAMLGGAAGPIISGSIAGLNIRGIFAFNAIIYLLMMGFVYRNVRH
jgi:DHA1 family multidrug resistance protein-like MFS transporter